MDNPLPKLAYSSVNGFHSFVSDAELMLEEASKVPNTPGVGVKKVMFSRVALLLYVMSLEALINRVAEDFIPNSSKEEFYFEVNDKGKKYKRSLKSKWLQFPKIYNSSAPFDKQKNPWLKFSELIDIRNDYAHFKPLRVFYGQALDENKFSHWEGIPEEIRDNIKKSTGIVETMIYYPVTRVPKDPYGVGVEHVQLVKKIVEDVVSELDTVLEGNLKNGAGGGWLRTDVIHIDSPPYTRLVDVLSI